MDTQFKQSLKAKAHHLKPVILLGAKGLTDAVMNEIDLALNAHELIKIKLRGIEKEDQQPVIDTVCNQLQAEFVQLIGTTVVIYRKKLEDR